MREISKIKTIEQLLNVCQDRWTELADIKGSYLSDTGKAAMEAYSSLIWHISFHDTLESLKEDENFQNLVNIPDKHPEYYKIVRYCNRTVWDAVK